jgi:hypothetical protein
MTYRGFLAKRKKLQPDRAVDYDDRHAEQRDSAPTI